MTIKEEIRDELRANQIPEEFVQDCADKILALFNVSDSNQWTCEKCGTVPNEEVTFEETHDGCGGYCS